MSDAILVLNSGSSSIKFSMFPDMASQLVKELSAKRNAKARSFRLREEPCPNVGNFGMTGRGTDRAVGQGDLSKTPLDKPLLEWPF